MGKTFTYADAVTLLGAKQSRIVTALEKIAGVTLLGGVAYGIDELLSWFDAKVDLVRYSHELLIKAGEKRRGLTRYDQTQRLQAAHSVIVVVAFFEVLLELKLPIKLKDAGINKDRQSSLVGFTSMFDGTWLLPTPDRPYDANINELGRQYDRAGTELLSLLTNCAAWDKLDDNSRHDVTRLLSAIDRAAVRRYEELIRKLASEYLELQFWLQLQHNAAMSSGMARLQEALEATRVGAEPDPRRAELANGYRAVLKRPIIDPDEVPDGLEIPFTCDAYIDPDFQLVAMSPTAYPAELAWWRNATVRSELSRYLVGFLTSPKALTHPLLILGDPGSGKSLLTKVLAARLPATDFLAVRVELRAAATESELHRQIDHGLSQALHEDVSFAHLARTSGDALPVVLLDGFDELLQATGVSQSDYLDRIQAFQRERADIQRPVAVLVTSRISVSSGMRIPPGTDVVRLMPFTEDNISAWLQVWNASNVDYFQQQNMAPLAAETAMAHHDLAVQPLLLLMLALYDAADNALQRHQDSLGRAGLYEKLLHRFASREINKGTVATSQAAHALDRQVELELERLSVVAFAMFHRGAQWVTASDLDDDLQALLGATQPKPYGMRKPLTEGDRIVGRFFFVQCAKAIREDETLRTYEFLHATFGEYLVARFTWHILNDLHVSEASRQHRVSGAQPDDSHLHALLSLTPLTSSNSVIDFLIELADTSDERASLLTLTSAILALSQHGRPRTTEAYQPVVRTVPARHAIYSLNLVIMAAILGRGVLSDELGITDWSTQTTFWKSQLSSSDWRTLISSVNVRWSTESSVAITIGSTLPDRVEFTSLHSRVTLREAALDAHFTGDASTNKFKYAFEALPEGRFNLDYARALIELLACPVDPLARAVRYQQWANVFPDLVLDALRRDITVDATTLARLAGTEVGASSAFVVQILDRLGRGGDDATLLKTLKTLGSRALRGTSYDIAFFDAWLRLYEAGFMPGQAIVEIVDLAAAVDLVQIEVVRPDLIKRLDFVLTEAGITDDYGMLAPTSGLSNDPAGG